MCDWQQRDPLTSMGMNVGFLREPKRTQSRPG